MPHRWDVGHRGLHPISETWTAGSVYTRYLVPFDVTTGWTASPVDTRTPGPHLGIKPITSPVP